MSCATNQDSKEVAFYGSMAFLDVGTDLGRMVSQSLAPTTDQSH